MVAMIERRQEEQRWIHEDSSSARCWSLWLWCRLAAAPLPSPHDDSSRRRIERQRVGRRHPAIEGTDQQVTAEQAAELAFLWKAYESLVGSDSTAAVELNAVLGQIQDALSKEQLAAVSALDLTSADIQTLADTYGISVSSETASESNSGNANGGPGDMGGAWAVVIWAAAT